MLQHWYGWYWYMSIGQWIDQIIRSIRWGYIVSWITVRKINISSFTSITSVSSDVIFTVGAFSLFITVIIIRCHRVAIAILKKWFQLYAFQKFPQILQKETVSFLKVKKAYIAENIAQWSVSFRCQIRESDYRHSSDTLCWILVLVYSI